MKKIDYQKLDKEELEKQKLVSEVRDNNRPFLIRYFSSVAIFLLTVVSLFIGFYTGLFDAKKEKLELEIIRFEKDKKVINDSIKALQLNLDNYNSRMGRMKMAREDAISNEKKALEDLQVLININSSLGADFVSIKSQNIEDKQQIIELTNLISKYENSSTQNVNRIKKINQDLQDISELYERLKFENKNYLGKIEVLNNTEKSNFDAIFWIVLDENNLPIRNVNILFKKSDRGPFEKESDIKGEFFIRFKYDNFYKGRTFPISISKKGYETVNGFVVVGSTIKTRMKKAINNI